MLTAGYDPLRDEGRAYADRLIDAGVKTTYVNYPGTIHGFFSLTRFLQPGAEGQRRSGGGDGGILRDLAMAWLRSSRLSRPIRNQWKILQNRLTRECPLLALFGHDAMSEFSPPLRVKRKSRFGTGWVLRLRAFATYCTAKR